MKHRKVKLLFSPISRLKYTDSSFPIKSEKENGKSVYLMKWNQQMFVHLPFDNIKTGMTTKDNIYAISVCFFVFI